MQFNVNWVWCGKRNNINIKTENYWWQVLIICIFIITIPVLEEPWRWGAIGWIWTIPIDQNSELNRRGNTWQNVFAAAWVDDPPASFFEWVNETVVGAEVNVEVSHLLLIHFSKIESVEIASTWELQIIEETERRSSQRRMNHDVLVMVSPSPCAFLIAFEGFS